MFKTDFKTFFAFTIIIQLYRLFVLLNAHIDLYVDEAYYWGWSKALDFGYYSKPPMIAWIIALFTSICGDSELCIKLPSLVLYPITATFIYLIAKELFDDKIAFWSGIAFITLPAVSMSSLIISTDVVLLLFWSATLYFFIKAINSDRTIYWALAAIGAGFGLLSKYTMIIFVLSVFVFLIWEKRYRRHLKNPKLYLTMIAAALIYFPNLIWNASHHYISFIHTKKLSGIEHSSHFHPEKLAEFLASQFLVFGPIFFGLFLVVIFRPKKEMAYRLLLSFSLPFLAIISLQALLSKALANWAAPTYIAATILTVAYLIETNKRKLLKIAITINILLALLFYHYHTIAHTLHIPLTSKSDPFKRVLGYKALAKRLQPLIERYPNTKLLFDDRTTMAEMIYYLRPHPFDAVMFNPKHILASQYHLTTDLNDHLGEDFLFITKHDDTLAKRYFESTRLIATIRIPLYKDYARVYRVYLLHSFKGY